MCQIYNSIILEFHNCNHYFSFLFTQKSVSWNSTVWGQRFSAMVQAGNERLCLLSFKSVFPSFPAFVLIRQARRLVFTIWQSDTWYCLLTHQHIILSSWNYIWNIWSHYIWYPCKPTGGRIILFISAQSHYIIYHHEIKLYLISKGRIIFGIIIFRAVYSIHNDRMDPEFSPITMSRCSLREALFLDRLSTQTSTETRKYGPSLKMLDKWSAPCISLVSIWPDSCYSLPLQVTD